MKYSHDSTPTTSIVFAFERGDTRRATELFVRAGGDLYPFNYGYEALGRIIEAMPEGFWRTHEAVLGAYVLFLAKQGRAGRAIALLSDPEIAFEKTYKSDTSAMLLTIHLGDCVSGAQLDKWMALERLLPVSEPLREGLYYNAILVFLVRNGRIKEARVIAQRALSAYKEAKHNYLEHFIFLHLCDLALLEGRLQEARNLLNQAKRQLEASGETYGNAVHIIEVSSLALDYEIGLYEHIPARASSLRQSLVSGDSWVEIFEQLARVAVKSTFFLTGPDAALAELELFRAAYAQRHGGISEVLNVLEISIDRLNWSFGDVAAARAKLDFSKLKSPIARTLLAEVTEPDRDINSPSIEPEHPRSAVVQKLRNAARETGHQRRRLVEQALWLAVKQAHMAPLLEHRDVLSGIGTRLSTGNFARGHVHLARFARRTVKCVQSSFWIPEDLRQEHITQKQFRIITALQSGQTNKEIARSLAISEATVKYHLAKLYHHFQVSRRGELLEIIAKNDIFLRTYPF